MTLEDRLNQIIQEQGLSKAEFARRVGVSRNYISVLTGNSRPEREKRITPTLAKLIALEFGYDENWILYGKQKDA